MKPHGGKPKYEAKYFADKSLYVLYDNPMEGKRRDGIKEHQPASSILNLDMVDDTRHSRHAASSQIFAKTDSMSARSGSIMTSSSSQQRKARLEALRSLPRSGDLRKATMMLLEKDGRAPSNLLDALTGTVIIVNAVVLGLTADIQWAGWQTLEYFFTAFFLGEMLVKMHRLGIRSYFFGHDRWWNCFDFFIVMIALADAGLTIYVRVTQGGDSVDLGQFTQIKMLRLGRLGRLVRLLRFRFFAELKVMIQGVFAGLRVLFWAVVLFFSFIYFLAIILRNVVGDEKVENGGNPLVHQSFGKVPWAMFTLFMCLTDGCTAPDGTPLATHLFNHHGAVFLLGYMLVVLFVTIGLFNLIMAIFVDNVMESKRQHRQEDRAMDRLSVESRLRRTIRQCCMEQGLMETLGRDIGVCTVATGDVSMHWNAAYAKGAADDSRLDINPDNISMTRDMFCNLLSHPKMDQILEQLDVETCNRVELFDVLDADMSGELDLEEIISGLLSLRGPAEKKDAVGALLCARCLMQQQRALRDEVHQQFQACLAGQRHIRSHLAYLTGGPPSNSHEKASRN